MHKEFNTIPETAVAEWLRRANVCRSLSERPTWYLRPHPDMLLKWSEIISQDMSDVKAMKAAAAGGVLFATNALFKACKEQALIIQAWKEESSISFALSAYGIDPKIEGIMPEEDTYDFWCQFCSWSFCPYCHRRRPEGPTALENIQPLRQNVRYKCKTGTCSKDV